MGIEGWQQILPLAIEEKGPNCFPQWKEVKPKV
jgi:hypothetical protein